MTSTSITMLVSAIIALPVIAFAVLLPAYALLLAGITFLRSKRRRTRAGGGGRDDDDGEGKNNGGDASLASSSPWSHIATSFFRGTVFHARVRPTVHSFRYPLHFCVADLDEVSELFGAKNVIPQRPERRQHSNRRGSLWPLSSLMMLRDVDHLKNGEGLPEADTNESRNVSMRERISNLVYERTDGKLDLRTTDKFDGNNLHDASERSRILLVTHLMYFGYCFNPVSIYFILRSNANDSNKKDERGEEIEAIVVEVSNTPWNEMSIYVLHPESVDVLEHNVYPPDNSSDDDDSNTHRYKWRKNFHVSPFMTMDHDYDWKFRVERDRIRVEAKLIRREDPAGEGNGLNGAATGDDKAKRRDAKDGVLYFTAGFDIRRTVEPTSTYPFHLARVIIRFPIYCFIIQLWIHYEALRLLMKGVEFIPHPDGSETGASRAIAAVMAPVFAAMDIVDAGWSRWKRSGEGKSKSA